MAKGNLVYGVAGSELVFLDAGLAQELADLRDGFGTWGQARAGLSASRWRQIMDTLGDGGLLVPSDDVAFDLDYIPGYADGDWPEWPAQLMLDWMPRKIIEAHGAREDSVLNGEFVSLDPAREAAVAAALQDEGWALVKDEELVRRACGFTAE